MDSLNDSDEMNLVPSQIRGERRWVHRRVVVRTDIKSTAGIAQRVGVGREEDLLRCAPTAAIPTQFHSCFSREILPQANICGIW